MQNLNEYIRNKYIIGPILLIIAVAFAVFARIGIIRIVNYGFVEKTSSFITEDSFSDTYPKVMLQNLWLTYKDKIQKDGRTIDRGSNYITTSEGQSYSLLRSVWMDDQDTFDRVLKWTNNNLRKRAGDKLFAWKWGESSKNTWGVMPDGGINTASDADQDIALALIFAYKRWNQESYLLQAQQVLDDIWRVEVLQIGDDYYMLAGNWAKTEKYPTINPSYLSPAAYSIFAAIDPNHPWEKLKDTSYKVLLASTQDKLDKEKSANLPPDWVSLDRVSKNILPIQLENKSTHFADDAFRVIWRVGLDWQWNKDPRARDYLSQLTFLRDEWEAKGKIMAKYDHDGVLTSDYESNSTYGGVLPLFKEQWPELGKQIYTKKLTKLYDSGLEDFASDIGYYAQNWVWFGMAYYNDYLVNLYALESH